MDFLPFGPRVVSLGLKTIAFTPHFSLPHWCNGVQKLKETAREETPGTKTNKQTKQNKTNKTTTTTSSKLDR